MRRALITGVMAAGLLAPACTASAGQQLGSATPRAPAGRWSFGAGYGYCDAEWEAADADQLDISEVTQNMFFADIGYGFTEQWEAYLRVGGADWKSVGALPVTQRVTGEDDFKPYFSLGVRGSIYRRPPFAVGFTGQYSYFSGYEVTQEGDAGIDIEEPYEAGVSYEEIYDLNLGVNVDFAPDWGAVYLGWFWFRSAGKAEASVAVGDDPAELYSSDIEENASMGGFAGLRLEFGRGWNVTAEGQYKTRASGSVSLNKVFGV